MHRPTRTHTCVGHPPLKLIVLLIHMSSISQLFESCLCSYYKTKDCLTSLMALERVYPAREKTRSQGQGRCHAHLLMSSTVSFPYSMPITGCAVDLLGVCHQVQANNCQIFTQIAKSKIDICGIVQVEAATRTRLRQAEKPDKKEWRSWSKRSRAPSARTTSKSPRSFPAFTTTARDVSRRWPREQVAPTNPFPVQSVAPPPSYLKATLTSCKPPSLSTE